MNRDSLRRWLLDFLEAHQGMEREALADAFVQELPGVVVDDDDLMQVFLALTLHRTDLSSVLGRVRSAREDRRPDGTEKVQHILEDQNLIDHIQALNDLLTNIDARRQLLCPECHAGPPACKFACGTQRWRSR